MNFGMRLILVLHVVFLTLNATIAQIDTLGSVSVSATVTFSSKTQMYRYSYRVTNPATSTGKINDFEIDISRPSGTLFLDRDGLVFDEETAALVAVSYSGRESLVTAISFPSRPAYWTPGISNELMGRWFTGRGHLLSPGNSLSGFVIQSKGLPTIRIARVSPYFNVDQFPNIDLLPTDEAVDSVTNLIDSLRASLPRQLRTVGPVNPPSPLNALNFLDTMKSYVKQSRLLNWITTDRTAENYMKLVDSLRTQILKHRGFLAHRFLDLVITNAKRDNKSNSITSEAYALLRYNAEFFKTHLAKQGVGEEQQQ